MGAGEVRRSGREKKKKRRKSWGIGGGAVREERVGSLSCDPGDTRPHNLQVQADAETVAFVFFFLFFFCPGAFCHDGLL